MENAVKTFPYGTSCYGCLEFVQKVLLDLARCHWSLISTYALSDPTVSFQITLFRQETLPRVVFIVKKTRAQGIGQ